ncbi:MAG TPA: tetratricopeptide repeat protein [Candidatus Acidoferrales bacterium]|nr:tetratricopeptide repeat protein [Candidatus Acidoferrales bacterium]
MRWLRCAAAPSSIAIVLAAALATAQTGPAQTNSPPTFAQDIAPIVYRSCSSCHRPGESGPFPLLSYDDAKKFAPQIAAAVSSRAMPPWLPAHGYGDFTNDTSLTDSEIHTIVEWAKYGAPQGPPDQGPPAPKFTEGWELGTPDIILDATRAYTVPPSGPDVFWNFIFSPQLSTKRYVRAIEVRPGIPHGVHHANLLVDRAGSARSRQTQPGAGFPGMDLTVQHSVFDFDSHFLFWKPGSAPWVEPDGLSWELDPGTDLILNAHIMTMGMPMQVKPSIGLYFSDKPPTKFPLLIELERDGKLDIPAGARDFTLADDLRLPLDVDALAVYPHAHYLGHLLEAYATLPNGHRKWLIKIPDWDPNWQAVYHYREPVFLPKGTLISMRWHFDNSTANPRNPHKPPQRVVGGNQSTDEMAHLWLQVLPRGDGDRRRELEQAVMQHNVEKNPGDFWARLWLGALRLSLANPAGAEASLETAVRIDPSQPEGHNWLGLALGALGRSQEAISQFRTALVLKPDYANASFNLARTLARFGRYDEAASVFTAMITSSPNDPQIRNAFGEALLKMHKPADALAQFDRSLALDPSQQVAQEDRDIAQRELSGP